MEQPTQAEALPDGWEDDAYTLLVEIVDAEEEYGVNLRDNPKAYEAVEDFLRAMLPRLRASHQAERAALLEAAAKIAEDYPKYGDSIAEEIRALLPAPVQQAAPAGDASQPMKLLAKKHEGMRVDYSGLLWQCQRALRSRDEGGNAEMLRQLQGHLKELGQRWYAGDIAAVDEILQLYCIEEDARAAIASKQP